MQYLPFLFRFFLKLFHFGFIFPVVFFLFPELLLHRCTYTVSGQHEPSVIMKDNDLKYKIRLPKAHSQQLLWQLSNDADFLLSIGVMDYSLLGKLGACYRCIFVWSE